MLSLSSSSAKPSASAASRPSASAAIHYWCRRNPAFGLFFERFHGEIHSSQIVDFLDLNPYGVAEIQYVRWSADQIPRNFTHMHEAVLIRQNLHKRAEVFQSNHLSFIHLAGLHFFCKEMNLFNGGLHRAGIHTGHENAPVLFNVDRNTGFVNNLLDRL